MHYKMVSRAIYFAAVFFSGVAASAQEPAKYEIEREAEPWRNIDVINIGIEAPRASFFGFESRKLAMDGKKANSKYYQSLNGSWQFKWAASPDQIPAGFHKQGFDASHWNSIEVPSVWERQGFGYPVYANVKYPFHGKPFMVPMDDQNHVGSYIKAFTVPKNWDGRRIYVRFGAVSSAMTLWVNGKKVGYNQGSRTPTEFDLTDFVQPGKNSLAVEVMRWSDASWLENQDSWSMSGIFRDVDLYARAQTHIRDYFAQTYLENDYKDGLLKLSVDLRSYTEVAGDWTVEWAISTRGKRLTSGSDNVALVNGKASVLLNGHVPSVERWSAEAPNLHDLMITLKNPSGDVVEVINRRLGFRSVEMRNNRVLVNGKAIKFKGVNLHEIHRDTGYVVDEATMLEDIHLMKAANFNAVRTSHYPQAERFYELADQYGLYLIDEANLETHLYRGAKGLAPALLPEWRDQMLDRIERVVERDKNHASVIFWSLGNETGMGENITAMYNWAKERDPSRLVQYADATYVEKQGPLVLESQGFGDSSDILSSFYNSPWELEQFAQTSFGPSWILAEYAHAMGNSLGNFQQYWDLINRHDNLQGGFIWDWVDQALAETDENGKKWWSQGGDYGPDSVPSDGNFLHNGVIFPDRTPKPGYYEVKYAHQDVAINAIDPSGGKLTVENRFAFTDLVEFKLVWNVTADGKVVREGSFSKLNAEPGQTQLVELGNTLPEQKLRRGEYFLNLYVVGLNEKGLLPAGHHYAKAQFPLGQHGSAQAQNAKREVALKLSDSEALVSGKNFKVSFDPDTGLMTSYKHEGKPVINSPLQPNLWRAMTDNDYGYMHTLNNGDWRLAGQNKTLDNFTAKQVSADMAEVKVSYNLNDQKGVKLADFDITYVIKGDASIQVNVDFFKTASNTIPMRLGLGLSLSSEYSNLEYFGRGPHENYADRNNAAFVGRYSGDVSEQYVPYLRPQENGNKTDTRWIKLTNKAGKGMMVSAEIPFSFSALKNRQSDFQAPKDNLQEYFGKDTHSNWQKSTNHEADLPKGDAIYLNIDHRQAGVGGDNSWGKRPHNEYMLTRDRYQFSFTLKPAQE